MNRIMFRECPLLETSILRRQNGLHVKTASTEHYVSVLVPPIRYLEVSDACRYIQFCFPEEVRSLEIRQKSKAKKNIFCPTVVKLFHCFGSFVHQTNQRKKMDRKKKKASNFLWEKTL